MGKLQRSGDVSVFVYDDTAEPRMISVGARSSTHDVSIWMTVDEARGVAKLLAEGVASIEAKFPSLRVCDCGATVGESGVLEDGKATCGACYLAANNAPVVDGEVQP